MKDLVLLLSLPLKKKNQSETTSLARRLLQIATNRGEASFQYCNSGFIQTTVWYLGKLNCIFCLVDSQEFSVWTGCRANKPNDTISNIRARKKTCMQWSVSTHEFKIRSLNVCLELRNLLWGVNVRYSNLISILTVVTINQFKSGICITDNHEA